MIACAVPAFGAVTTYTDLASFNAAAGATTLETFNSFVVETEFRTAPLNVGGFTIAGQGAGQSDRNFIDIAPHQFAVFDIDGSPNANLLAAAGGSSVLLTFNAPITAFGAQFAAFQDSQIRTQIVLGGDTVIPAQQAGNVLQFLGFVSDTAFTTVLFEGVTSDGFSIDNVRFGGAAVPEPATWAMMIAGFGLAGAAMRRRSAKVVFA